MTESDTKATSEVSQLVAEILRALELSGKERCIDVRAAPLVAAWDYSATADCGLGIYAVGTAGAKLAGYVVIPAHSRSTVTAALRRFGLRVGGTYGGHGLVWIADERGCSVWSKDAIQVTGTGVELNLKGQPVHTADVRAVVSFVDDDLVHRGVSLELLNGHSIVFVDEYDEAAQLDPTYSRNDLLMSDARWVSMLGRDLAGWLHVPHRDVAFG